MINMFSINDLAEKVKSKVAPFYTLILCVVIAGIFFALGRLSAIEERHEPIRIIQPENGQTGQTTNQNNQTADVSVAGNDNADLTANVVSASSEAGEVVGSKNSKKYYFPWCSTVKNIKPENQVQFASADLAKQADYVPGGNCKGLK